MRSPVCSCSAVALGAMLAMAALSACSDQASPGDARASSDQAIVADSMLDARIGDLGTADAATPAVGCIFTSKYGPWPSTAGYETGLATIDLTYNKADPLKTLAKLVLTLGANPKAVGIFSEPKAPQFTKSGREQLDFEVINKLGDTSTSAFTMRVRFTGLIYAAKADKRLHLKSPGKVRLEVHGARVSGESFVAVCEGPQSS